MPDATETDTSQQAYVRRRYVQLFETFAAIRWRAYERAQRARHKLAGESHLATELLREAPVCAGIAACGAEFDVVEALVLGSLDQEPRRSWWELGPQKESPALVRVYQRTAMQAVSAEVKEVTPLRLLLGLLEASPPSVLAERLHVFGLEPTNWRLFVAHGRAKDDPLPHGCGRAHLAVLNDEFTPFELVTQLLGRILGLSDSDAQRMMRRVHAAESAVVGIFDWQEARDRGEALRQAARNLGYPLDVRLTPAR